MRLVALASVLALPVLVFFYRQSVTDTEARIPPNQVQAVQEAETEAPAPAPEPAVERQPGTVRRGDTISDLLGKYLTPQEIYALSRQSRKVFDLRGLCAGQDYELCTLDGAFESFAYDIDRDEQLVIRRDGEGFEVARAAIPYRVEPALVKGTIRSSLFEAVTDAGESADLALALADIFAWDVDFILDIRQGDSFEALVEKRFRDGEPAGYGNILAAQFVNQGQTYRAIRFQDDDRPTAYYDLEGKSLRKAFLRAPLAFTRISSGFSWHRFHPITKTWKAHPAIDYAAPVGTPIKSVGDGTIIKKGYTKYNGNYIKIRHNSAYETLYLHMSRFARSIRRGSRVTQGQVIGYVGQTGLATGPHLCFRMYKNGTPVNPRKVRSVAAAPVSRAHLAQFREEAAALVAKLVEGDEPTRLAARTESEGN